MLEKQKRWIRQKADDMFVERCDKETIKKALDFYKFYEGYRTPYNCAREIGLTEKGAAIIERYLRRNRKIGAYYFEADNPPQKYMKKYILDRYGDIGYESRILEIGPGNNPIFSEEEYVNWIGVDKGFDNGIVHFHEYEWGYVYKNIYSGGWETLESTLSSDQHHSFDLVCGSHSFEHTYAPIKSLKSAGKMLKKGGKIVLFVPNGYSQDPGNKDYTHTIYMVPEMIEDFFENVGGFRMLFYEEFRPDLDYVITAEKV